MKSPQVLVEQMTAIKETYGIGTFDLIHDMFTVDRKKVVSFCEALVESGQELYWSCSARTDCLDDEMISLMKRAGCNGVFFGIDTGSDRMQAIIHKRLNLSDAAARIRRTNRHKINTTVSLIVGFPEENKDDLRATVSFLGDCLHYQQADPQFHLLAPLAETPITTQYKEQLVYDDIFSDISFQGWEQDPEERAMIIEHRDIFPNFYGVPTRLDRDYLRELREFILRGTSKHRWLMVLLHRDSGDLLRVFDEWKAWSIQARDAAGFVDNTRSYYGSDDFSHDLLRFIGTHYLDLMAQRPHLVETMTEVERGQLSLAESQTPARRQHDAQPGFFESMTAVPAVAGDVRMVLVSADYKRLIRRLKRNERLRDMPAEKIALVLLKQGDETKVIQLNRNTYELIRLCNGSRTVMEVAGEFSSPSPLGISSVKAGMYGLASLFQKGLIEIRAAA